MLSNPGWDTVIAWLKEQPSKKTYCYFDPHNCMAAQYNDAMGRDYPLLDAAFHKTNSFDKQLESVAYGKPRTMGAALKRARKCLTAA